MTDICPSVTPSNILSSLAGESADQAIISWSYGFSVLLANLNLFLRLPYCGHQVNQLLFEVLAVLQMTCGDTWLNEILIFAADTYILVEPLSLMLGSYMCILWAVLKIHSKEGLKKDFSICSSHLCEVEFYFRKAITMYLVPDNNQLNEQKKIISLLYTLFNPLLNPRVYNLNNAQ